MAEVGGGEIPASVNAEGKVSFQKTEISNPVAKSGFKNEPQISESQKLANQLIDKANKE